MKFTVEYRRKGEEKSCRKTVREGQTSMRLPKPNETYELRDVAGLGGWQECKADSRGEIGLHTTLDSTVGFISY